MDRDASSASSPLLEAGLPRGRARSAGILLHGRDRTREEKVVLASSFQLEGIRWLAPAADTGSWYPGRFFDPVAVNEPFLSQAIDRIDRVVDEAGEGGRLGPSQIFLVGFSQGACLALEYAEATTLDTVDDDLRLRLKARWSDDALIELTGLIAFQNLSAKFNSALDVPAQGFCRLSQ